MRGLGSNMYQKFNAVKNQKYILWVEGCKPVHETKGKPHGPGVVGGMVVGAKGENRYGISGEAAADRAGADDLYLGGDGGGGVDAGLAARLLGRDGWDAMDGVRLGGVAGEGRQGAEGAGQGRAGVKKPARGGHETRC